MGPTKVVTTLKIIIEVRMPWPNNPSSNPVKATAREVES